MVQMLSANIDPNAVSSWFVVAMGIGVVFAGLIALIFICKIIGATFGKMGQKEAKPVEAPQVAPVAPVALDIPNKGEFVAAVSAAIAESMGTDVSKIRIHSIKKV